LPTLNPRVSRGFSAELFLDVDLMVTNSIRAGSTRRGTRWFVFVA
jgi:hypothetical protein